MTFLAVAASLHKKQSNSFFSVLTSGHRCGYIVQGYIDVLPRTSTQKKHSPCSGNVAVTPPKEGVSILPFLRFICVIFERRGDPSQTSSPGPMRNVKVSFLLNSCQFFFCNIVHEWLQVSTALSECNE